MSDPHGTDPRRSDLPRRPDLEAPSSGGSMWAWLAALVVILAILGMVIGYNYNRTEQASDTQSNAPTTTGAAPSEPRPAPPANPGGNASRPAPATPAPAAAAPMRDRADRSQPLRRRERRRPAFRARMRTKTQIT
jgi:hypothetical protein